MRHYVLIAMMLMLVTGCSNRAPSADLFDQLGGSDGINALADEFVYRLSKDVRVAHYFEGTDFDRFEALIAEQFCAEAGGPCQYSGATMADSHRGLGVDRGDFNAVVEVLIDSMETLDVPIAAQNGLLAQLAPMHADIVER